ncbi:deoxyribodipyrimidine photolyase [Roseomonas sp. PWR1]|uniref:Deoxyribodipyrimidine photolyase n=1 Tax=Roseomonas nitratireducens TaxID=2820810 RepID=A0ABS4AU74_9PROT|nr:FAD-binding domain-containing protein [Neoroseomonas nitratireducens]MBP0464919.1 deoxyribodipyrimidine photolyase [Neoroseomonas nitratireducens]
MTEIAPPSRAAALARLDAFAPRMGRAYEAGRNHDPGPGARRDVSMLSPHVRHRLVTERDLVAAAISQHGPRAAEKFIQEVFWRSYWKGWLEMRPVVWDRFRAARDAALAAPPPGHEAALRGETGIACFDAWARELIETGWLHNHARMWFASIWIFTLRLPWALGADVFLRHLLDADAASNTLSWRWVAGMQTRGKHYVARAENIARFTGGRFDPRGQLEEDPAPLDDGPAPPAAALPPPDRVPEGSALLLLHEDDLHPESLDLGAARIVAVAGVATADRRSPVGVAPGARAFAEGAMEDALARAAAHFGVPARRVALEDIAAFAAAHGAARIVTPWAPVGWTADALAPLKPLRLRRDWDSLCWPRATKGFFAFREHIPALTEALVMRGAAAR